MPIFGTPPSLHPVRKKRTTIRSLAASKDVQKTAPKLKSTHSSTATSTMYPRDQPQIWQIFRVHKSDVGKNMFTYISQLFLELLVLALLVSKIAQYLSNTIQYYMQFLDSREIEWHLFCKLLLQLTVLSMPKGCNSPVSTFEPALFWMITFFCGQTLYIFLQITFCSFYKSSPIRQKERLIILQIF